MVQALEPFNVNLPAYFPSFLPFRLGINVTLDWIPIKQPVIHLLLYKEVHLDCSILLLRAIRLYPARISLVILRGRRNILLLFRRE